MGLPNLIAVVKICHFGGLATIALAPVVQSGILGKLFPFRLSGAMMSLTIENFWKPRLGVLQQSSNALVRGWSFEKNGLSTFREAPLSTNADLTTEGAEQTSTILLISAPGAVGKSTLARQVAYATGAVYIDLAEADPVGGNTLSGGLVKSDLYSAWQAQSTAVLIDGLDEARLRVTQEAFKVFLDDIAQLAKGRAIPTALFGRTGAIQDTWILLDDSADVAVLEIGYYGRDASIDFANAQLRDMRPDTHHADAERRAISVLLERLRAQTESDGDRFAGYAPVLRAVARRVADVGNPAALISEIVSGEKPVTLKTVVDDILNRERSKLSGLQFDDPALGGALYSPGEQLDRLVARRYGINPPSMPPMSAKDAQTYSRALENWVSEHPFLDGGTETSSAVFDAVISTHALRSSSAAEFATQKELRRGAAANPFLSEFYIQEGSAEAPLFLPPEHVGILYSSLRARLSFGDSASLSIDGPEGVEDEQALRAEVEIVLARRDAERPRVLNFDSEQTGMLRLGAYVEDVEIEAAHAKIELGPGPEAILVAPVIISCDELHITTEKVIAEAAGVEQAGASIYLEARKYVGAQMLSVPLIRRNVSLSASWPGVKNHPWTSFESDPIPVADPRISEALRRFRKFIIAFRSHSKGSLARYRHKLEHTRMTKGSGAAVLKLLLDTKILSLNGSMYFLNPDLLGELAGTSYAECMNRRFNDSTVKFIKRALA